MAQLFSNISNLNWQQAVMWLIGGILIYLAVKRDMEPALLLPMGFGAILVNLPLSGAVTQAIDGGDRRSERAVRRGHRERAVPAAAVRWHRGHDRF